MQNWDRRPLEEVSQAPRALEQRQVAQILAVEVQEVEGIEVKANASMPAFRTAIVTDKPEPRSAPTDAREPFLNFLCWTMGGTTTRTR